MSDVEWARRALFSGDQVVTGAVRETMTGSGSRWADEVVRAIDDGERAVAVIAFEPGGPALAHIIAPEPLADDAGDAGIAAVHEIVERPSREQYAENVRFALERIETGALQKVVLGRSLEVTSAPPLRPRAVLNGLLRSRPGRYVFGMPLGGPTAGAPPQLIGASPELLVRRMGRSVFSTPLAGSVPRAADPGEDRSRADELRRSSKDLAEHAFVVDEIVAALEPICDRVVADAAPRLVSTDTLHHLGTHIVAELSEAYVGPGGLSALHLAQLLQPTPAVGGVPRHEALEVIAQLEADRGPLTGAVGWVDGDGDGEFAVTIRAGVLDGERLRLFAGAGIVAGSDPASEVRETGAKLATMLKAVGV